MLGAALLVASGLGIQWLRLIDAYAVNVFVSDQWDFWTPMFREESFLAKFTYQHGTHTMGAGYLVIDWVGRLSDWHVPTEAVVLVLLTGMNAGLALWLKFRLVGRWHAWDVLIPLMILSYRHYAVFLVASNPSLNVVPLSLVLGTALCWTGKVPKVKYGGLAVLNVLALYTGYTFFSTVVILILLVAEIAARRRVHPVGWPAAALAVTVIPLGIFIAGFNRASAAYGVTLFESSLPEHIEFLARLWGNIFLVRGLVAAYAVLVLLLAAQGVLLWWILKRLFARLGDEPPDGAALSLAYLAGYSAVYTINCVVIRVGMGLVGAHASRYIMHQVPLLLGLYIFLQLQPAMWKRIVVAGIGLLLAGSELAAYRVYGPEMTAISEAKAKWLEVYRRSGEVSQANRESGFKVYPWDEAQPLIELKLDYMKAHGLGLFAVVPADEM